jgi:hypothetical protein
MKVRNLNQLKKLDPEDIKSSRGEKERESKRKKLINRFLIWSKFNKNKLTE